MIDILSFSGGRIVADGGLVGIGSHGEGGLVQSLRFSGNPVLICNTKVGTFPVNATSVVLSDASLIFVTQGNRLFGASPSQQRSLNLTILYGNVTWEGSEPLSRLNANFLQIADFKLPLSDEWVLCISGENHERCFGTETLVPKGIILSVPSKGNYSIRATDGNLSAILETPDYNQVFEVNSILSFVQEAGWPIRVASGTVTVSHSPENTPWPATPTETPPKTWAPRTSTGTFTQGMERGSPRRIWAIGFGWLLLIPAEWEGRM
jgi:hypothetical protein